jgi:hypothetical protein
MRQFYRKITAILALALSLGFAGDIYQRPHAYAASIALLSGPNDPSQGQLTVNQLIGSINAGVAGLLNSQYVTSGNGADTTEDTLYTYTLPAGYLNVNGKGLRIKCFGNVANNADTKTVKLYFGAEVISGTVSTATTNAWISELEVWRSGAAAVQVKGSMLQGTAVAATYFAAGTDTIANAVTIKCTGTGSGSVASEVAGQGFSVEVIQ